MACISVHGNCLTLWHWTTLTLFIFPLTECIWQGVPGSSVHTNTVGFIVQAVCTLSTLCFAAKGLVCTALFSHPEWTGGPLHQTIGHFPPFSIFSALIHGEAHWRAMAVNRYQHLSLSTASSLEEFPLSVNTYHPKFIVVLLSLPFVM